MRRYCITIFFIVILVLLNSCGKAISPKEINCEGIYRGAGISAEGKYKEELSPDSSYFTLLGYDDYEHNVESGIMFRDETGSDGHILCVLKIKGDTELVYGLMCDNFEFPPCEESEKAIIAMCGNTVMYIKSNETDVESIYKSFCGNTNGAKTKRTVFIRK